MASNALITITYAVAPAKKNEFESILRTLVDRINSAQQGVRFSVYRDEDDANTYVEVYECDSTDTYDSLEDNLDDDTRQQIQRIATDFAVARQSVMTLKKAF